MAEPAQNLKQINDNTATLAEQKVDVLIIGSGPAGLTLAAQLSAFPNINTRFWLSDGLAKYDFADDSHLFSCYQCTGFWNES